MDEKKYNRMKQIIAENEINAKRAEEELKKAFKEKAKYVNENKILGKQPKNSPMRNKYDNDLKYYDSQIKFRSNELRFKLEDTIKSIEKFNKDIETYIAITDSMAKTRLILLNDEEEELKLQIDELEKKRNLYPEFNRLYTDEGKQEFEKLESDIEDKKKRITDIASEKKLYSESGRENLLNNFKRNIQRIENWKKVAKANHIDLEDRSYASETSPTTPPATPPTQTPPATPPTQTPPATPPTQTPPTQTESKIEILVKGKKGIEIKFNNANNQYSTIRISSRKLRGNIDKLKDRAKMKYIEGVVGNLADEYRNEIYNNMSFLDNSILKAINIAYKSSDDADKEKIENAMRFYVDGTIQKKLEKDIVDVTYYRSDLAKLNIPLFSKVLGGRFSRKEKEYINNMSEKTENWTNSVGNYTKNPIKRYLEDRKTKKLPQGKNEMLDRLRGHRFFEGLEADKTEEEIERENRTRERIRAGREANKETSNGFERDD